MLQRRLEVPVFASAAEALGWLYVSERITARGAGAAGAREPDYIQDPGVFLDFVFRKGRRLRPRLKSESARRGQPRSSRKGCRTRIRRSSRGSRAGSRDDRKLPTRG